MTISEKIVAAAKRYIGEKEKTGNSGFKDPAFEAKMKAVGWKMGEAWCVYFCEVCWREGFENADIILVLDKLFSGSATATFANFASSGKFKTGMEPRPGAIGIFKHGNSWQGHAVIVTGEEESNIFETVEGNSNSQGGREGIEVIDKTRLLHQAFLEHGLNLMGFIYPE